MKKPILILSLAFLSLNTSGSQQATRQATGLFRALLQAKQTARRVAIQAVETVGVKGAQKAPQVFPKGWTPPTSLKQPIPLKNFDIIHIPAIKASATAPLVTMSPADLSALWNNNLAPVSAKPVVEEPATPVVEQPQTPTLITQLDAFEDQGAFFNPTDNEENAQIKAEPLVEAQGEEDALSLLVDEDVILFDQKQVVEETEPLARPTTRIFEEAQAFMVENQETQGTDTPVMPIAEDTAMPVAAPLLVDTAFVVVDNGKDLEEAKPTPAPTSLVPAVDHLKNTNSALATACEKITDILNSLAPKATPEDPNLAGASTSTVQKVITGALATGTAAVIAVKKPGAAKQLVRGVRQAAATITQPTIAAAQHSAKELITPVPKQTRYFTQAMFKKATSNGNAMIKNFNEAARSILPQPKVTPIEPAKIVAPKTPRVKAIENSTGQKVAEDYLKKLEREQIKIHEKKVAELKALEKIKAQEDAIRLEQEEAARLKKQADDAVTKLNAELKAKEIELKKIEEAQVRKQELADAKIKQEAKAQEDARFKKQADDAVAKLEAELKAKEAELKKIEETKVHEKEIADAKAKKEAKAQEDARLKKQAPVLTGHVSRKPVTTTLIPSIPKMKSYLPKKKPKTVAPKPTEPAKEEPKNEEPKKEEELKPKEQEEELESSPEEEKHKKVKEEEEESDTEDSLTKKKETPEEPAEEKKPEDETPVATPAVTPQAVLPKVLAPRVRDTSLAAARPAWAAKINVQPVQPFNPHVPTTAELNEKASRQRTVELPFGNNDQLVIASTNHSLQNIYPTADASNAHPESGFIAPHDPLAHFAPVPAPRPNHKNSDSLASDHHVPISETPAIAVEEAQTSHYPDTFPNLAAKKESQTKVALDFGKEIISTTVIQPLKQLARYVIETVSNWFN